MDTHGKTMLVAGATGNQGGATARHLLADGWHVRALVRHDTTPAAAALAAAGADLVLGDLDDRASCDAAVRGAYGVYSVQSANHNQVAQGRNIADAAKAAEVRHLVYSSVGGVESRNRFYLEHGWGPIDKWQVEEHLRKPGHLHTAELRHKGGTNDDDSSFQARRGPPGFTTPRSTSCVHTTRAGERHCRDWRGGAG